LIQAEFSSSLLSLVSHDPSEIILKWWFDAQKIFIIIINVKNSWVAVFSGIFDGCKEQHLFEIEYLKYVTFCTVTW